VEKTNEGEDVVRLVSTTSRDESERVDGLVALLGGLDVRRL
jgi:hypothetical protein